MGKPAKATKKFERKHLKGAIDHRKQVKKFKKSARPARKDRPSATTGHAQGSSSDSEEQAEEALDDDDFGLGDAPDGLGESSESGSDDDSGSDIDNEEDYLRQLSELQAKDPSFYEYLAKNDAELLKATALQAPAGGEGDSDSGDDPQSVAAEPVRRRQLVLTAQMVSGWEKSLRQTASLRTLAEVILAFKAAAFLNDGSEAETRNFKYTINQPDVFERLAFVTLKQTPIVLEQHVPPSKSASSHNKFKRVKPLLKSYSVALLHLIETMTDEALLRLIFQETERLLPYFVSFRKVLKKIVSVSLNTWGTAPSDSVRISALLLVRRMSELGDPSLRSFILKHVYQVFIANARVVNAHSIQHINFMKNSAAPLFAIDPDVSYRHVFLFIRQMAIHLRTCIQKREKDSFKLVYNWQYCHSLDFWSIVVCGMRESMPQLIYPLTQIALGAIRLLPSASYFPYHFHVLRSINRIQRETGTFVPTASLYFTILNSAEVKRKAKPSTLAPLDFELALKAPTQYVGGKVYQQGVVEQVMECFSESLAAHAASVSFPELVLPVVVHLKRYIKESKNPQTNRSLQVLAEKLNAQAKLVTERRRTLEFDGKHLEQMETEFAETMPDNGPFVKYVLDQRKVREERRKMLAEAAQAHASESKKGDVNSDVDSSDDEEDDDGSESVDEEMSDE